jgi:thiol:disulfide interchange protein
MMKMSIRRFAALLFAACALPLLAAAQPAGKTVVSSERVRAELMALAPDGVAPGKQVWVGLQLAHQPDWHTYWKNSGDSGLPTQLEWTLPPGVLAGDIAWPLPKKIPIGHLANYGYEGTVLLPVPLTITPDFKPSAIGNSLPVKLKASWLVCRKECIPEDGEFSLDLPVQSTTALNSAAFQAAFKAQPQPLKGAGQVQVEGNAIKISVDGLPASARGKTLEFFPETGEVIETAAPWKQSWQGALWTAEVPLSAQRTQAPKVLPMVVAVDGQGWRSEPRIGGEWPPLPQAGAASTLSPALSAALSRAAGGGTGSAPTAPTAAPSLTFMAALLGAVLGGLILNLMPCVFPILAIKVVGFTRHAGDRRGHRVAGLAYTAGVVASFVALGGLMLALRAAGEQLGWGFQLQSPGVVAALAVLFTLLGLNLAGLFQFGAILPTSLASMEARHPVANSFLSGVLAVAIASPCTAPFMGASLGLAIGLPAAQALLVFAAIGIGMAVPYLAASWVPAVARLLPRPGAWMETFRHLMAFPMFATVAWLVWVLGQQSGIDGAGALLGLLVAISMVIWAFTLRGRARPVLGAVALGLLALLAWATAPSITRAPEQQSATTRQGPWQSWQPGLVQQLVDTGQPVFVDFTAAWCVTCQYNKKTTLERDDVLKDFAAKNVALLRADWTRRDPAITAALGELGRNGVPVYVIYKKGATPVVLTEVLSPSEVQSAIAAL